MPGSTEPERVPIINPSSGVKPIEVETDLPASTAVTEQPLPRWATTRPRDGDDPRSAADRSTAHDTDSPWKPKRRMPHSLNHESGTA